jgi:hypothetical protein
VHVTGRADAVPGQADPDETYLGYTVAARAVRLDLSEVSRSYAVAWIDDPGGRAHASRQTVSGGHVVALEPPAAALGRP